jgi:pimeloyl-ACP methyl ester carboxylesterase
LSDLFCSVEAGAPPPVVLLHEGAGASPMWQRTRAAVVSATGRATTAFDRRGFGASPRDASFGLDHFDQAAADLVVLLDEMGSDPADLVGHSDGGTVALLAAARRPDLVRSVVAVATHVYADASTVAAVRGLGRADIWDERTRDRYRTLHGPDWIAVVTRWLVMWTEPGGVVDWDMRGELSSVSAPVLVVHDKADPLSPATHAETIEEQVPAVQVRWYDSGSHRPHVAEPERFVDDVCEFWGRLAI